MKTSELLESDGDWRLKLRSEMTKFNQQFGIYLRKSIRFDTHDTSKCDLGGNYEFGGLSDTLSFSKEQRFEFWQKAYAKKIKQWVDSGYKVQLYTHLGAYLDPKSSEAEILQSLELSMNPRYRGSNPEKMPLEVYYKVVITKPTKSDIFEAQISEQDWVKRLTTLVAQGEPVWFKPQKRDEFRITKIKQTVDTLELDMERDIRNNDKVVRKTAFRTISRADNYNLMKDDGAWTLALKR